MHDFQKDLDFLAEFRKKISEEYNESLFKEFWETADYAWEVAIQKIQELENKYIPKREGDKIRVDLETIQELQNIKHIWDNLDVDDVVIYENGKLIELSESQVEEWRIVGLSILDFISHLER